MARPLRIEYPGALYHVTCRMVGSWKLERNELFVDDKDRERFLDQMADRVDRFQVLLYQYCLMTNHLHLSVETPHANISAFMQSLTTAYSTYFNRRHDRHGHLLDGRFGSQLVEKNAYISALSQYVHLNPVATEGWKNRPLKERRTALRRYKWSSYPQYIGLHKPKDWVSYDVLLRLSGGRGAERRRRYRHFVELGLVHGTEEFEEVMKTSRYAIGTEEFSDWVEDTYVIPAMDEGVTEDQVSGCLRRRVSADRILEILCKHLKVPIEIFKERRRNVGWRSIASRFLLKYSGLSQREVAVVLEMGTGGAVSKQVRKYGTWLEQDETLRKKLKGVEKALEKEANAVKY